MPETEDAPAKLNLYLRVLGRRPDGYHDIDSVTLRVSLHDRVTVTPTDADPAIRVAVAGPGAAGVPSDEANLAARAAAALRDALGRSEAGAVLDIEKRIPVGAGLGGGSADAAAALRVLGRVWDAPGETVRDVAIAVGSDVPALLHGGPVRVRGRGEDVSGVEVASMWWVLLPQPFQVSSRDAYRWWDEDGARPGPEPDVIVEAASVGDVDALSSLVFNDLEPPVSGRHTEVVGATRSLLEAGALTAIMCGSGPTVAGLCRDAPHAAEVAAATEGIAVHSIGATAPLR